MCQNRYSLYYYMLMMGREVNLPIDILYPKHSKENEQVNMAEYVADMRSQMERCHAVMLERQNHNYNTRIAEKKYNPATT